MGIPDVTLSSASSTRPLPVLGLGTGGYPFTFDAKKKLAVLHAIELGYHHLDTSSLYQTEQGIGEAVAESLRRGLINSRADLFITSKLWCTDAHSHGVIPAIRESLRNLKMDYLDLYLIHWPLSQKPGSCPFPIKSEDIVPLDLKSVWEAMEECQRLGLAKSIGVSNFTQKKLMELLEIAKIPPAVNQVELNPVWQQVKLREFCKEKGIHVIAYSPLGGQISSSSRNLVMESEVLQDIAKAKGKSVAQVSLRWIYEQGACMVAKSLNKERLKENMEIFDWQLNDEDHQKISQIPQCKRISLHSLLSPEERSKSFDLLDYEIID
ncbi:non-functional NADPH-dependent codeinone reductase 2 [Canna indica]|uniref:Non-functional NADPH-dependent codeinone reductase 2 n=1 Tax=Canna indica TaxID=4628 RepID=A0AAQ3L7G2_9LILI|nr:non-functional NADPH-dependent codeinone reductase 2 [Canna indica]